MDCEPDVIRCVGSVLVPLPIYEINGTPVCDFCAKWDEDHCRILDYRAVYPVRHYGDPWIQAAHPDCPLRAAEALRVDVVLRAVEGAAAQAERDRVMVRLRRIASAEWKWPTQAQLDSKIAELRREGPNVD
jgi:hypothetical protein